VASCGRSGFEERVPGKRHVKSNGEASQIGDDHTAHRDTMSRKHVRRVPGIEGET